MTGLKLKPGRNIFIGGLSEKPKNVGFRQKKTKNDADPIETRSIVQIDTTPIEGPVKTRNQPIEDRSKIERRT